ncbi:hypothetical protein ACPPVO_47125 [Dactylosporangium sp. McL0621]|uniref:hypothetical protein n=1 Tax=Dactylosporangium sp. McL0621 TaxID=3415678 RepID=UPI003CFA38B9
MSKRLPAQRPTAVRYVAYPDVATPQQDPVLLAAAIAAAQAGTVLDAETAARVQRRVRQLDDREERQRQDYLRWLERRAELDRQDRRTRSLLLGVGATVGLGVLGGAAYVVWLVSHAAAALALAPVLGVVALVLLAVAGVRVGSRCVTVISHWHE